ncbi:hypothetical protein PSA01_23890 [Pseudonocardia saturnea]|nr:hypothetical protein PSA01_23890 [Pseudonocardia saturnea]
MRAGFWPLTILECPIHGDTRGHELDRLRARVAELEAGREIEQTMLRNAAARISELEAAASPDDAPTTTHHVEWLTVGTDEDGDEGVETFETEVEAVTAAGRWRIRGMTNVYVERHDVATTRTVSTTTRTTAWKADER